MRWLSGLCVALGIGLGVPAGAGDPTPLVRSQRSGPWSAPSTWEGDAVPRAGARVQIRPGHRVIYDASSNQPIRSIHVAGTLTFATDRATRLDVGLIKIQRGEDASEDGFACDAHLGQSDPSLPGPALVVGSPDCPVAPRAMALIRLVALDGLDRETCPAIVCCGGRMDFHGAPMNRTWVKLGRPIKLGETAAKLAEPVDGWRVGDRVILTTTQRIGREQGTLRAGGGPQGGRSSTEERTIAAIDGTALVLDRPAEHPHRGDGDYRGEVANLSRNVIVESADPAVARGHTMYHRGSSGSISYAEFRHLGKEGVLGRYSLHFHLVGDSMRGSSVIGASIWDSANRWITIHGTNDLVVRDCVGYRSLGHGFYLEDGSESYNILDRNLAVQALAAKPLPGQFLPFDRNDGAGFWWANSLNSFTRNVAAECDHYGYRYEATPCGDCRLVRPVLGPDGRRTEVDIRTLPFVQFRSNEAHAQIYGMNMGEGVDGVGPGEAHPYLVQDTKIWDTYWAFRPDAPSIVIDGMDVFSSRYGVLPAVYDPRVRTYGRAKFQRVSNSGVLPASPMVPPGAQAPLPVGVDDRPPTTVITRVRDLGDGLLDVRGSAADDGRVRRVLVNGREARAVAPDFLEWEVVLDPRPGDLPSTVTAYAEDIAGNVEKRRHIVRLR
jgi:hypothetical protein